MLHNYNEDNDSEVRLSTGSDSLVPLDNIMVQYQYIPIILASAYHVLPRFDITESQQYPLTHWGRDKMAAIFQTTFLHAFSWMKMYKFRLRFHWSLFPRVKLTIFQHWFRLWLGADQATSHFLNQWWLVYWRIYASLGLNELRYKTGTGIMYMIANK